MSQCDTKLNVLLIGGGMISEEVLLPTLFQEQAAGRIGKVSVATRRSSTIQHLRQIFPGREFTGYPEAAGGSEVADPDAFQKALADLERPGAVVVATPDHLHTPMILAALEAGFDVVTEKPLCIKTADAWKIIESADEKAAYVYTDYHKRHDRAIRALRYRYRRGWLGEMLHGHAWIEEKREIPLEKFVLWAGKSSPFEYIGVHYVDAYYFVTGLKPRRLVAFAQKKLLVSKGIDAYDTAQATIEWEDNSVLFVQTSWVNSNRNSTLTNQGMMVLGTEGEYWADHKARGLHFVTERGGYEDYNPNFFKAYDDWDDPDKDQWTGYGYDSLVMGLNDIRTIYLATRGLDAAAAKEKRRQMLANWADKRPLPRQALIGTAVIEAARISFENNSAYVGFDDNMRPRLL